MRKTQAAARRTASGPWTRVSILRPIQERARRPRALFRREVGAERLNDRHVGRLVKRLAAAAGVRRDLSKREREIEFAGRSLRAGLASSARDRRTLEAFAPLRPRILTKRRRWAA